MSFRVKILKNRVSCIDRHKKVYRISKVKVISKNHGVDDWFYERSTSFYKAVCTEGTMHMADVEREGTVIIY